MKKHRLTIEEFEAIRPRCRMQQDSLTVAYRVLVLGESQVEVHRSTGKSRQNVGLLVNRFWNHYEELRPVPAGWRRDTVTLPLANWLTVRAIEAKALAAWSKSGDL